MATVYSVLQINTYIKNMFKNDYLLRNVQIKGELSNVKYHSSGHIYFTLKDDGSALNGVMFRQAQMNGLNFTMENGQSVVVTGNVDVYERDGRYQIYAREIAMDGMGNLYEAYERLKQKLYEEGLFEFDIKKEIPKYPRKVGIVTARTGAAIQDILNIAKRRNPYVQLYLYPARVQGEGAAETIVHGIEVLDKMGMD
ncbi:MAG: exodeoxyribonuclease VII large subunit, partial [Lachnospiraceae bacterium]|nr:exodeoxyribonuclease VII large subunit [Lachnospiraceae bacterium]